VCRQACHQFPTHCGSHVRSKDTASGSERLEALFQNLPAGRESIAWLESIDKQPWLVEHVIAASADDHGSRLADIIVGNAHGYGLDRLQPRVDRQGNRSFARHAIEEHYASFHTMTLADVNGDGKPDIVVAGRGGLYALIHRGLTPSPRAANPKLPPIGDPCSGER